ncbi:methyl-accepting chemotaxis protein [Phenylobacterium sp.]|uniref:methyl-accepting chemotaxis protein n=1 Tax=Phenylobacterium sp. TaxID=1871053 RepID=UPI0025FCEF6C|nr:HAMP domain-containing methyl-accepting chemotaxis protein [Phenylobacterium sp.]
MKLTIRARLIACLAALSALLCIVAGLGVFELSAANARLDSIIADRVRPLEELKAVSDMYAVNVVDTAHKVRSGALTPAQGIAGLKRAEAEIKDHWSAYTATRLTDEEARLVREVQGTLPAARSAVGRLNTILAANDRVALDAFVTHDLYPAIDPVTNSIGKLVDLQIEVAADEGRVSDAAYHNALIVTAVVFAVASVVLAFSVVTVLRQVIAPLRGMTEVMKVLAGGRHDVEVPAVGRTDEIGEMAGAVQHFKQAGIDKQRLEQEAAEQRAAAEAERARDEAQRTEAARLQAQVVTALADGLDKLSAGDLAFRVTQPFAPEYEKLRVDFNGAMQALEEAMRTVSRATHGIRAGSQELSRATDDMSRRTEQQAASLEETAAALDQITATVRRTAISADDANTAVRAARQDAERSGEVVGQAIGAMGGIESSSRQISQIIGVIDEIAFQTNLLALNAGVEAARAGDAGKGFAVVASEVRALAQRSAEAAKEIKTLISESADQVGAGVGLVRHTGEALNAIIERIGDIAARVAEIASSAQEQSAGLQQVNTAVNHMDQATQQNAAMVEETTAASGSLAQEADGLSSLVARFNLSANDDVAAPRTVRALKVVSSRGGAAVSAAPEPDGWDEF